MDALYSTAAARRIDHLATAGLGGDGYLLMQRAGQAGWRVLLQRWPGAQRLVVACGRQARAASKHIKGRIRLPPASTTC